MPRKLKLVKLETGETGGKLGTVTYFYIDRAMEDRTVETRKTANPPDAYGCR